MMKRSELVFALLRVPLDAAALWFSFWLSYAIREGYGIAPLNALGSFRNEVQFVDNGLLQPYDDYLGYVARLIPIMLLAFVTMGLYQVHDRRTWIQRLLRIFLGVTAGIFAVLLAFLVKDEFLIPRATILYAWVIGTVAVFFARTAVQAIQRVLYRRGVGVRRIAYITDRPEQSLMRSAISRGIRLTPIACADVVPPFLALERFDGVLLGATLTTTLRHQIREYCLEHHYSFLLAPDSLMQFSADIEVSALGRQLLLEVRPTPLEGWGRIVKRLFDIVAGIALTILSIPVYLAAAIIIRIADPGPVFYVHRRIGRNGKEIGVLKIRSMYLKYSTGRGYDGDAAFQNLLASDPDLHEEWHANFKLKKDPRIIPAMRIFRKTNLDELPQFINVVAGELSLVGPRAIIPAEVPKYGSVAGILFSVRPGLTGLWQVSGRNDISYEERVAIDEEYIMHWSFWRDVRIMFKTAWVVLQDIGKAVRGAQTTGY